MGTMKTALICGLSGQDGAYLARFLLKQGYRVCGTSRDAQMSSFDNLERLGIRGEVEALSMAPNDFRSVLNVISRVRPDEIYNLSGQSSVGLSFEQPMETMESIAIGTLNILEVIRFLAAKVRFYSAGSSECFGNTGGVPANEDTPLRPCSPYGVAKTTAFWEVANYREGYRLYACTGVLFNHESPLRPARFVTRKVVAAACRIAAGSAERLTLGNLAIERDWGWAPEYVEAMWRMLQQPQPADFVIASGSSSKLSDFVETAFACVGLNWEDHVDIDERLLRPTDLMVSRADPGRAAQVLGWRAGKSMAEVVRLMVEVERGSIPLRSL